MTRMYSEPPLDDEAIQVLRSAEWTLAKNAGRKLNDKAKAEREQEEARLAAERQARETEYTRARVAAEAWLRGQPGRRSHADADGAERFRRHVCDLAAQVPAVRIEWLAHQTHAAALIGKGNALAHLRDRAVVCPPVTDSPSAAAALHELGHLRDRPAGSTLTREVAAWKWARMHSLAWDQEAQNLMLECLGSYLKIAKKTDVLDVIAAERFLSHAEFQRAQLWRKRIAGATHEVQR